MQQGKSWQEVMDQELLQHSHFMTLEFFTEYKSQTPIGPILYRPSCDGMLAGDLDTEQAYIARNGPIFSEAHPEVERGT